jgi:drug/metabolite transporter (DMT)-like permease
MEPWVKYALIAAVFISVKNMITKNISAKYKYIDYLVYAISLSFICIWTYVITTGHKVAKVDNSDFLIILVRIFIVYVLIDPAIYKALQTCGNNAGKPMCIINMEVILTFIFSVLFLQAKIEGTIILGIMFMIGGGYLVSYS